MNERQLVTEPYVRQVARWPESGRHILAQFDAEAVVIYPVADPQVAARTGVSASLSG